MADKDKKVEKSDLTDLLTGSANQELEERFDEQSRKHIFEALYGGLPDRFDLKQFMKESLFNSGEPDAKRRKENE